jgi:hypothetical protein
MESLGSPWLKLHQTLLSFSHSLHAIRPIPSAIDACTIIIDKINHIVICSPPSSLPPCRRSLLAHAHRSRIASATERRHTSLHRCSNTEKAALFVCAVMIFRNHDPTFPAPWSPQTPTFTLHSMPHHLPSSMCLAP